MNRTRTRQRLLDAQIALADAMDVLVVHRSDDPQVQRALMLLGDAQITLNELDDSLEVTR